MVETLIAKTVMWEKDRGKEFTYDGVSYFFSIFFIPEFRLSSSISIYIYIYIYILQSGLLSMMESYMNARQEKEQEKKRQRVNEHKFYYIDTYVFIFTVI